MKSILYTLSIFLVFIATSCSENSHEPEPPSILDTEPKAVLMNDNGTYYTLHDSFVRLRNADGSIIKSLDIEVPAPVSINAGYGDMKECYFSLFYLSRLGNNLVSIAMCTDYNLDNAPRYAITIDPNLTSSRRYEIANAMFFDFLNDHLFSFKRNGEFFLYDQNIALEKSGKVDVQITNTHAIGYYSSNYYALAYAVGLPNDTQGDVIIDFYNEKLTPVSFESVSDVIKKNFPNETNEPRYEKQTYAFVDDHLEVTYYFTLFDGSKKEVVISYDMQGHNLDDSLVYSPVHIDLEYASLWDVYGVHAPGEYTFFNIDKNIPAGFVYNSSTFTGFGGVLLLNSFLGEIKAFDAACPVEASRDVSIDIDTDSYVAVCHKCGSKYDVFQGNGAPLSGKALELKYGLKQYRATHLGMGYVISN